MTLDELSKAWNDLRNAALGQGLTPNVKPTTATTIGNYYERWRTWLAGAGVATDMAAEVTAAPWLSLYRDAARLAKADGAKFVELEQTAGERAGGAVSSVVGSTRGLLYAAAAVVLPLFFLVVLKRRR